MDINMLNKLVELAQSRLDRNDVAGASDAAKQIEALEPNWLISYFPSGLLIDVGSCANDQKAN